MKLRISLIFAFGLVAACSSTRKSALGEVCFSTADCDNGLSCLATGTGSGSCQHTSFPIQVTPARSCVVIECIHDSDCCPAPVTESTICVEYYQQCQSDLDGGTYSIDAQPVDEYCTYYYNNCVVPEAGTCDVTLYKCNTNPNGSTTCSARCATTTDCTTAYGFNYSCVSGSCVAAGCAADTDCETTHGPNWVCQSGSCIESCTVDGECAAPAPPNNTTPDWTFQTCQGGLCTNGYCNEDRDCVFALKTVGATCVNDPVTNHRTCQNPCTTDLECGSTGNGSYNLQACQNGVCTFIGCDDDSQCQSELTIAPGTNVMPAHASCASTTGQ